MNSKYKIVLFDLDGTLTESGEGIKKSILNVMKQLNKPLPNLSDTSLYIGPPLLQTFVNVCGLTNSEAKDAVEAYIDFYAKEGKSANKLFNGLICVLEALKSSDARVAVATSKYEEFAKEIIEYLNISQYFDAVCGSTKNGSRKEKEDIIIYAVNTLNSKVINKDIVLIGDSKFDTIGAKKAGCDFIGVTYGYGTKEQMKKEGCTKFADKPKELLQLLF